MLIIISNVLNVNNKIRKTIENVFVVTYNVLTEHRKEVKKMADTLERKRTDAEELIKEVLRGAPESTKIEILRVIQGYMLNVSTENKKAG